MKKITMDNFKDNKGLIALTIVLGTMLVATEMMPPEYYNFTTSMILLIISIPLTSWWFEVFWNKILTKVFKLQEISYGVALLLIIFFELMF